MEAALLAAQWLLMLVLQDEPGMLLDDKTLRKLSEHYADPTQEQFIAPFVINGHAGQLELDRRELDRILAD